MTTTLSSPLPQAPRTGLHRLVLAAGAAGAAWNLFGIARWASTRGADADALMASGLSAAQAQAYLALPGWMDLAFAVGVFAGLIGCVALMLRRRAAVAVLAASLAAYVALFTGDAVFGLFSAMPRQLGILVVVVAIAAALLVVALRARAAKALR